LSLTPELDKRGRFAKVSKKISGNKDPWSQKESQKAFERGEKYVY
jgi:hypothetical protein